MEPTDDERRWRYGRWGSVLLSYDCFLGIPMGLGTGAFAACSQSVRDQASGVLIGVAGVCAAVATLVLTSLTVLFTTISPDYRKYVARARGGLDGVTRPYKIVVTVAAAGTALGLAAAFVFPAVRDWAVIGQVHIGAWMAVAPAMASCVWACLGCVQLTGQLVSHWKLSIRAANVEAGLRDIGSPRD